MNEIEVRYKIKLESAIDKLTKESMLNQMVGNDLWIYLDLAVSLMKRELNTLKS